jgi:xanthine dehydrogenase YagS FAD-binding subunit
VQKFEYASPTTKEQAVALLGASWGETEVLAGGTDLLSLMKDFIAAPKRVVNIKNIKELDVIRTPRNGSAAIGALVSVEELIDTLGRGFPAITDAAKGVTSPQIRNMGTVGGDLLQRPRCWYYRAGFGLFAKGENGEPLVPNGDNRYHAILGNESDAKFVNPSSLAPAFIALNAKIKIFGPSGEREVAADKFFVTPKSDGEREFDLKPNEIVTWISIPPAVGVRSATYEVRQKEALDWPLAAASVAMTMDANKKVKAARIALGHVAPVPWLAPEAAEYLIGKEINEDVAAEAGKIAVANAKPLSRNAYKVQLARVAVKRAIMKAAG